MDPNLAPPGRTPRSKTEDSDDSIELPAQKRQKRLRRMNQRNQRAYYSESSDSSSEFTSPPPRRSDSPAGSTIEREKNTESSSQHEDMTMLGQEADIIVEDTVKAQTWEQM